MTPHWRLHLPGAPQLHSSAESPRVLALSRKDAAWLAYVAAQPQASSAALAALLWPDAAARGALNNLRQRVHRLRRATGARLVEMSDTIALAADLVLPPEPERVVLEADPAAWDGELLGAFEYDDAPEFAAWLAAARRQRREARREALAVVASDAERDGQIARALVYTQRLVADDPLSEHAYRRLMRLHYLRGDSAAAVAAFEGCERALKDELGLRPSAETLDLLRTVEQGQAAAAGARAVAPLPASLSRPPRLVGRDAALAELALSAQEARVAVVVGEAGMGKTRLLQEFLAGCRDAALQVAARPGDGAVPYALLGRVMQALQGGEPAAAVATAGAQRLRGALEAALRESAAQGLQALAVDDLHFADVASVELLLDVALGGAVPALRWIVAQRPDVAADSPLLQALMQELMQSPQARFVALAPLDAAQLEAFVASLGIAALDPRSLAAPLALRTGGNPLFVIETLRATLAVPAPAGGAPALARPAGLVHLIDARLRRLSRPALALARVAAIAAPDFDLALAEGVLGAPPIALADAWHELEAVQVLRGEAFAHDLVHDALLRATPQVIAAHTHRRVAALLAERDVAPARLAQHWRAGGDPARAAEAFARASRLAQTAGRPREQAELLQQCAEAFDDAGNAQAALRARIERITALGPDRGADAAVAAADALLETTRGSPLAAHVLMARARALGWGGRFDAAEEAARQALDAAAPDDDAVRTGAAAILANAQEMRGNSAGALALLRPWQARAERIADLEFHGLLTSVLLQIGSLAEAVAVARRHLDMARQGGHGVEHVTALMNLASLYGNRGEADKAIEHGRAADRLIPDVAAQMAVLGPWNRAGLGWWLAGAGRFDQALQLLEDAVAALEALPVQRDLARGLLARVWVALGQTARAVALVNTMPEMPPGRLRAGQLALQARIEEMQGRRDGSETWRAVLAHAPQANPAHIAARIVLAAREGDGVALAEWYGHAVQREIFPLAAEAATLRLGIVDPDAQAVQEAEQLVTATRSPLYCLPEQLARCATAYRRLGREADARRCEQAALDWVYQQALPNVPAPFVESFLHRNPVNVTLRAGAVSRPGL